jgi:hypothetical protein
MLAEGASFKSEETARLYYSPPSSAGSPPAADDGREEKAINQLYDICLKTKGGEVVTIYNVGFIDMEEVRFCFEDGVGFLRYTDAQTGEEVSTKESALATQIRLDEEEKEKAEKKKQDKKARAEAEAAAAAEASWQPQSSSVPDYAAQTPDQCLDGPAVNF